MHKKENAVSDRRFKLAKRLAGRAGLPPGDYKPAELNGQSDVVPVITSTAYNSDHFQCQTWSPLDTDLTLDEFLNQIPVDMTAWLSVVGLPDKDVIAAIGSRFQVHPMILEDLTNPDHRIKYETLPGIEYWIVKKILFNRNTLSLSSSSSGIILTGNCVLTVEQNDDAVFNQIRTRIRENKGRIRSSNNRYLCYALIDAAVDSWFFILEDIGGVVDHFENVIHESDGPVSVEQMYLLRRQLFFLRQQIVPLRNLLRSYMDGSRENGNPELLPYWQDLLDHSGEILDLLDLYREDLVTLSNLQQTKSGNRMNEIMKLLTLISTVFIPLTFLAGIYGMNFEKMPELKLPWGYPVLLGVMSVTGFFMWRFFKKKRWL